MLLVLYVDMQWSKLKFEPNIQGQLLARLKGSAYCPESNALHPAVHKEVRLQIIERAQIGGGHTIRYCCPDSAGEGLSGRGCRAISASITNSSLFICLCFKDIVQGISSDFFLGKFRFHVCIP